MQTIEPQDFHGGMMLSSPVVYAAISANPSEQAEDLAQTHDFTSFTTHINIMFEQDCLRSLVLALRAYSNLWPTVGDQLDMTPETEYCRIGGATCPGPYCRGLPTEEEQQAPGIGLALDIAHATAVVRFHNGSYQNVAFIEGDSSYIRTMASMTESSHGMKMDNESRTVVAEMVEKLRTKVEAALGGAVTTAAVTIPDQISLPHKEFVAILELASIQYVMYVADYFDMISAVGAAYAGAGMGRCKDYVDYYRCERRHRSCRMHDVLQVDLSAKSLSATMWQRADSYKRRLISKTFVNTSLGVNFRAKLDAKTGQDYWQDVRRSLQDFVESCHGHTITYLILTGTEATHPMFQSTLRDVLKETVIKSNPQDGRQMLETMDTSRLDDVHLWQTARGAAEIAKRRQEGPLICPPDGPTEEGKNEWRDMMKNPGRAQRLNINWRTDDESHSHDIDPLEEEKSMN